MLGRVGLLSTPTDCLVYSRLPCLLFILQINITRLEENFVSKYEILEVARGFRDTESSGNWENRMILKINHETGETWVLYPITSVSRNNDDNDHGMSWIPVPEYTPKHFIDVSVGT